MGLPATLLVATMMGSEQGLSIRADTNRGVHDASRMSDRAVPSQDFTDLSLMGALGRSYGMRRSTA